MHIIIVHGCNYPMQSTNFMIKSIQIMLSGAQVRSIWQRMHFLTFQGFRFHFDIYDTCAAPQPSNNIYHIFFPFFFISYPIKFFFTSQDFINLTISAGFGYLVTITKIWRQKPSFGNYDTNSMSEKIHQLILTRTYMSVETGLSRS